MAQLQLIGSAGFDGMGCVFGGDDGVGVVRLLCFADAGFVRLERIKCDVAGKRLGGLREFDSARYDRMGRLKDYKFVIRVAGLQVAENAGFIGLEYFVGVDNAHLCLYELRQFTGIEFVGVERLGGHDARLRDV